MVTPEEVIDFWQEAGPDKWFLKDETFDQLINNKFGHLPDQVHQGAYDQWEANATGLLASILVLDQFPRNIYRNTPKSFSYDERARTLAGKMIEKGWDQQFTLPLKPFIYLPYMHSENREDQLLCIELCKKADYSQGVDYGYRHLEVIEKYGRFPHRNKILGRQSTPEELVYLSDENAGF